MTNAGSRGTIEPEAEADHSTMSDRESGSAQLGLSSAEAAGRLLVHGRNLVVPKQKHARLLSWLRMLADPMVILLVIAGVIYTALGEVRDAAVMGVALVPILGVNVLLEGRAERTLEKLRRLTEPRATVIRDGAWQTVPVEELVPGDVIQVQEGDVLPADGQLLQGSDIIADESALTGESVPLPKRPGADARLFAGTTLLSGRGMAEIVATGAATDYGKIGVLIASVHPAPTPLQRSIGRLVQRLFFLALGLCMAVVLLGLLRGLGVQEALIGGVSLAIAAIPEEFPVVYALYLTLGVWRLAREHALVRRMEGVETLGSTTVICTDKTGTLTYGRMEVMHLWTPEGTEVADLELLRTAALASEPKPFDPMEQAILARAPGAHGAGELVHEYPFDPDGKYMSHIWRMSDGTLRLAAKGSIEGISRLTSSPATTLEAAERANQRMAEQGVRVLAVAARLLDDITGDRSQDESGLAFIGLLGLTDPVRPEVARSVAQCHAAGIRVLMLTGDHPVTAGAIAREAGIAPRPVVLAADVLDGDDDEQVNQAVARADAFARIRPAEKLALVERLKAQGETVAMTGDGINDGPALRAADIGVAMGLRGTEVAREAAAMVLLDDNFNTIVSAVRDGRRILTNVRRAFSYLVAFHVPILLSAVAAPLLGLPLLLEPIHLVWLELIIHPTASLVFEGDQAGPESMRQPPRSRLAPLVEGRRLILAGLEGLGLFGAVWFGFAWGLSQGWPEPLARNVAFTALVVAQIGLVLAERAEGRVFSTGLRGNRLLPAILGLTAVSTLLPYLNGIGGLLRLQPLGPREWLIALALAIFSNLWAEAVQALGSRFGTDSPPPPGVTE